MDSGVAPHLRGAGPIFLRPVLRNPPCVVRSLARLACGRSRCASVCVAGLAAPNFSWHAFYFISMFGKGMVGKGMVGEDEARANVARAPVACARRDVKGGQ